MIASRTASVSYKTGLEAKALAHALATGVIPAAWLAHVGTLIDEAPLPFIVAAVDEAARSQGVPPKRIWQHLTRWSHEMQSPRLAWA